MAEKVLFSPLEPGMTVEDRFKEIQGARRWQMILKLYSRELSVSLEVWRTESDGRLTPLLSRSRPNNRRQDTVVNKYARGILSNGVVMLRPESTRERSEPVFKSQIYVLNANSVR